MIPGVNRVKLTAFGAYFIHDRRLFAQLRGLSLLVLVGGLSEATECAIRNSRRVRIGSFSSRRVVVCALVEDTGNVVE